jgi:hypothetical protein
MMETTDPITRESGDISNMPCISSMWVCRWSPRVSGWLRHVLSRGWRLCRVYIGGCFPEQAVVAHVMRGMWTVYARIIERRLLFSGEKTRRVCLTSFMSATTVMLSATPPSPSSLCVIRYTQLKCKQQSRAETADHSKTAQSTPS